MLLSKKTTELNIHKFNGCSNLTSLGLHNNELKDTKRKHIPPGLLYKGGITDVMTCNHCGTISLFEESFETKPCWHCGQRGIRKERAIWNSQSQPWNIFSWGRGFWIIKE